MKRLIVLATCLIAVLALNGICPDDAHGDTFFHAWPSNPEEAGPTADGYNFFEAWPSNLEDGGEGCGRYNFFEAWPSNCAEDDPEGAFYRYIFFEAWPSR